jgi:hypothetical protein
MAVLIPPANSWLEQRSINGMMGALTGGRVAIEAGSFSGPYSNRRPVVFVEVRMRLKLSLEEKVSGPGGPLARPNRARAAATRIAICLCGLLEGFANLAHAQESPYFVTYDHHLEETGTLSIETLTTSGFPRPPEPADPTEYGQNFYTAPYLELGYGISDRLTTAVYLKGKAPGKTARSSRAGGGKGASGR